MESASAASKPYKYACERCRNSKLKCPLDTVETYGKCKRCIDADAECEFKALAPRQRRKRTDARITTLEKELRSMRSMLDSLRDSQESELGSVSSPQPALGSSVRAEIVSISKGRTLIPSEVSEKLARELYREFKDRLLPQYPLTVIGESFDELCASKPILCLAVLAAASSVHEPSLFKILHARLVREVTERAIVEGERSVELIHSILILETWYYPSDDLRRLNFYQWIHIAGTMALQLGLGGARSGQAVDLSKFSMERCRTMFAVFQSCSSVAISLRRQSFLKMPPYGRVIKESFSASALSLNDKRLVAWANLQVIAEDVDAAKWNTGDFDLSVAVDQLDLWEMSLEAGVMNGKFSSTIPPSAKIVASLQVHFHYCKAKLFESVLDVDHDPQELVPPFLATSASTKTANAVISQPYARALVGLVTSCHSILETIVSLDAQTLRACITTTFVKTLHALKVLVMLRRVQRYQGHSIHYVISADGLKIDEYVRVTCEKLKAAAGPSKCRIPSMILGVAEKIVAQGNAEAHLLESQQTETGNNVDRRTQPTDIELQPAVTASIGSLDAVMAGFVEIPDMAVSALQPYYDGLHTSGAIPNTALLSDFEEMVMPDFGLGYETYFGYPSQTFTS